MLKHAKQRPELLDAGARERRLEMQHLQAIEGNPLSLDQIALFELFEREGWSAERRLAYLSESTKRRRVCEPEA